MLEEVGYPLRIFLVGLLSSDSLDILGVSQANLAGFFKDIEDRNSIFTGRFHTDIKARIVF
jgi:hypothetical protein